MKRILTTILFALLASLMTPVAAWAADAPVSSELTLADLYPERYAELKAAREQQIEALRAYRDAGQFPDTRTMAFQEPLTVFLDVYGVPCAFAALMIADGERGLVEEIAQTRNNLLVDDVRGGDPVMDWILTSGLTHEEAIVVQEPGFRYEMEPVQKINVIQASIDAKIEQLERDSEASLETALERSLEAEQLAFASALNNLLGMR